MYKTINFKDRIFYGSLYRILGRLITIVIAFLVTPFLIRTLGDETYGLWILIIAVPGWVSFVDLGFSTAVQRAIAIALEANDKNRINVIFSCSVLLFGVLGLIAALVIILLSFFPSLLGIDPEYASVAQISLVLLSVKVFWDFGMYSLHGFYSGLIRYDIDANINTANEVIKALLILLLVKNFSIYGAVSATILADMATNIVKIIYAKKLYRDIKFDFRLVNYSEFGQLFSYSKHVIAMSIVGSFSWGIDSLIISHIFGLAFITIYGVANRLVQLVEQLYLTVLGVFLPIFTRLAERKGNIQLEVEQVFSLNFFLTSSLLIPLTILSEDFIFLWLGEGFKDAYAIVAALSLAFLSKTVSRPVTEVLLATAKHKMLSVVRLIGLVLNILLSIVIAQYIGLLGVAIGTVLSFYISEAIFHFWLYRRLTGYPIAGLVTSFLKAVGLSILMFVIGHLVLAELAQLSWLELIAASVIIYGISTVVFWYVSLDILLRNRISELLISKLQFRS